MTDIVGLVLPFFGMIFLGALVARITRQPLEALGWMNTFVIYVALPALFFQLIARTPVEELTEWSYIFGVVFSVYVVFALMFVVSLLFSGGHRRKHDQGPGRRLRQYRLYGPRAWRF
jgi:malonate transporter and related proteins